MHLEIILTIISSIFVLFIPGFVLSLVFFPRGKVDLIERLALSFALSLAVIPLIVFYTNLLGVKISAGSVLVQTLAVILIAGCIVVLRRRKNSL